MFLLVPTNCDVSVCVMAGLLLRMFMNLYNLEVIDEDAFMQWKEELNNVHPGKGQALFQVSGGKAVSKSLQCFDAVGWAAGRASGL